MVNELVGVALNLRGDNSPLLPLCQLSLVGLRSRGVREASCVPRGPVYVADCLLIRALLVSLVPRIVGGVLIAVREVCRVSLWLLLLAFLSGACVCLRLVPGRRLVVLVFLIGCLVFGVRILWLGQRTPILVPRVIPIGGCQLLVLLEARRLFSCRYVCLVSGLLAVYAGFEFNLGELMGV